MEDKRKIVRTAMIIAGAVILLFVAVVVILLSQNQPKSFSSTYAEARVQAPANPAACLATMDNVALRIPSLDQAEIFNVASVSINDLPVGVKVSVYSQTYDGNNVSGTVTYSNSFGSYNFAANKIKGSTRWLVKSFVLCQ